MARIITTMMIVNCHRWSEITSSKISRRSLHLVRIPQLFIAWGRVRSEERRVGKECRSRWSPNDKKKNQAWNIGQAKQAAMQQEMAINSMLAPYRADALHSNAMRDRAAIDYQQHAIAFQQPRAVQANR